MKPSKKGQSPANAPKQSVGELDETRLAEAIGFIESAMVRARHRATPTNKARLIILAYRSFCEEDEEVQIKKRARRKIRK